MKKSSCLLFLALILVCSCSPKVSVLVLKSYPPLNPHDTVMVYEHREQVPKLAEPLAKVTVRDGGMTLHCNYNQVLALAKNEAIKIGGNGLLITDHTTPSFWGSSCHQIGGTILRIVDFTPRQDTITNTTVEYLSLQENAKLNKKYPPIHNFRVNVGYGYIVNRTKGLTGIEKQLENDLSSGLTWDVQYQCFPKSIYGFGVTYSGYSSSATYNGNIENLLLTYIAPMYCMKGYVAKDWLLEMDYGLGYIGYATTFPGTANKVTASSVGTHFDLGVEYKISNHWGIGAGLSMVGGSFGSIKESNGYSTQTIDLGDQRMGVSHLKFSVGMRYYLQ